MFEPQRHRGTEKTQSHPPTSQTRRHEDTKTSQKPPPRFLTQRRGGAEAQRTGRESLSRGEAPTAGRSGTGGQGNDSDRKRSSTLPCPPACASESAGLATPPLHFMVGENTPLFPMEVRRNRRAPGASAGGKPGCDERLRSEQSGFLPAGGDRQIAACSAVNPRHCCITSATNPLCLRVFVFVTWARLRRRAATPWQASGSAPLRLCVSAFLPSVFLLCASVPLWFSWCLDGSPGCVGGKFEIRNSKFEI